MTMDKPWKVWLVLVAIFVVGGITGGLVGFFLVGHRAPPPPPTAEIVMGRRLDRVAQALGLSAEQKAKIEAITKRQGTAIDKLRRESIRASRELVERMESEIQAVLNPEQRAKFAEIQKQWQQQWQKRMQERFSRMDRPGGAAPWSSRPPPGGRPPDGKAPPAPAPGERPPDGQAPPAPPPGGATPGT
jgi:hypothetical protein